MIKNAGIYRAFLMILFSVVATCSAGVAMHSDFLIIPEILYLLGVHFGASILYLKGSLLTPHY